MHQLDQIRIQKQDRYCFLEPKFEKAIQKQITQFKQKNDLVIKIGCIISYFSVNFIVLQSGFQFQLSENQSFIYNLPLSILQGFACLLSGFFIDIISLKSTWCFTITSNIVFSLIYLLLGFNDDIQVFLVSKIYSQFMIPIWRINFICILYDSATDFIDRLNKAVILEVLGAYFPSIFLMSVNIVLKQNFNLSKEEIVHVYKKMITLGIIVSFLLNLISLFILNQTYQQIQKIKSQSIKYQRFLIYQGFGLSISKISKYMSNKNIYYLLVIATLLGFQAASFYDNEENVIENAPILNNIIDTVSIITGIIIILLVNSRKGVVQSNYKTASYCVYLFLVSCVSQFIIYQYSTQMSDTIFLIITTVISTLKEALFLVLYTVFHQIMILLLPNRITMRAISLSITHFPFFLFKGLCAWVINDLYWLRLTQIFVTLISVLVNYFYQRSISIDKIEQKLIKQYQLS